MDGSDPNLDLIVRLASEAGANAGLVRRAIREHTHANELDADAALAESYGTMGTPTFFMNGRRLVGAQRQACFERIVDEEIVKAQGLVARGVAPIDVYDTLTKGGEGPRQAEKKDAPKAPIAYESARDRPR